MAVAACAFKYAPLTGFQTPPPPPGRSLTSCRKIPNPLSLFATPKPVQVTVLSPLPVVTVETVMLELSDT